MNDEFAWLQRILDGITQPLGALTVGDDGDRWQVPIVAAMILEKPNCDFAVVAWRLDRDGAEQQLPTIPVAKVLAARSDRLVLQDTHGRTCTFRPAPLTMRARAARWCQAWPAEDAVLAGA